MLSGCFGRYNQYHFINKRDLLKKEKAKITTQFLVQETTRIELLFTELGTLRKRKVWALGISLIDLGYATGGCLVSLQEEVQEGSSVKMEWFREGELESF